MSRPLETLGWDRLPGIRPPIDLSVMTLAIYAPRVLELIEAEADAPHYR